MSDAIPWVFYVSEMGRPVVEKELAKLQLSLEEKEKLRDAMKRVAHGSILHFDTDLLSPNIWELRIRGDNRILRVLYFTESEPLVLVAVFAAVKKTQKTPRHWIDLAIVRRSTWIHLYKGNSDE